MEVESLEKSIDSEKNARNDETKRGKRLEKQIQNLKEGIARIRKLDPANAEGMESEGYKKLREQIQLNATLENNILLEKERLKILSDRNQDITSVNLDILSQSELIRMVKQLERVRNNVHSELNEVATNLDLQVQEWRRLDEMKQMYKNDLERKKRSNVVAKN